MRDYTRRDLARYIGRRKRTDRTRRSLKDGAFQSITPTTSLLIRVQWQINVPGLLGRADAKERFHRSENRGGVRRRKNSWFWDILEILIIRNIK